ncbi:MAG TPA: carboxymuconolactone decarboxylase family protein [Gemmatimonadaceae bacterium]|nr:carboxymuconolactone decarboxylase family protein [Gemmatimonadaceae bacterium]
MSGHEAGYGPGHTPAAHPDGAPPARDPDAAAALEEFRHFRERMNGEILAENNLVINRFFNLDGRAYEAGALDVRTKELLGLVASLVLRCDDCVTYHLVRCAEEGISREELFEACSIGLIVGGSIVIPHLRRAINRWTELERAGRGQAP